MKICSVCSACITFQAELDTLIYPGRRNADTIGQHQVATDILGKIRDALDSLDPTDD